MRSSSWIVRVLLVVQGLLSFRVIVALCTSVSVTGAVAGPLAYQASRARQEPDAARPAPTTDPASPVPPPPTTVAVASTTTSTTTTIPRRITTVPQSVPTSTPPLTSEGLLVSNAADHSEPFLLQGSRLTRRVWPFFDASGVTRVTFWLDDPTGSGPPTRVAEAPFDLAADGFDFASVEPGPHSLLVAVEAIGGSYRRFATFAVGT